MCSRPTLVYSGPTWRALGRPWCALGRPWSALRRFWCSGPTSGVLWACPGVLGRPWCALGRPWCILGRPWRALGRPWFTPTPGFPVRKSMLLLPKGHIAPCRVLLLRPQAVLWASIWNPLFSRVSPYMQSAFQIRHPCFGRASPL